MINPKSKTLKRSRLREAALARWNNEGGAGPGGRLQAGSAAPEVAHLTNTELVQLQIRVIALERVVMALLAHPAVGQLNAVREMADYIYPRRGHTRHRLTIGAAGQMISLLQGAAHYRARPKNGMASHERARP